jgi:hypothetical protein
MMTLPGIPRIEGLFELDQKGIDIRPTLLRVLTDQYVASPRHTPEEERQYTELAMRLIDETDIASRAAVAERLARHPEAPRSIVLQLARDVLDVAEPILRYSPCLTPADCAAIAGERGPSYGDLIAERGKPPRSAGPLPSTPPAQLAAQAAKTLPKAPPEWDLEPELDPKSWLPPKPQPEPAPVPMADARADAGPDELCELFFAAGSPERRLILMMLDYVPADPRAPPSILQRTDIWRIESSALAHNSGAVVREIEQALGVSAALARRIVNDELGEPIVVAAKAMNLPNDVVQRMLLFMNPAVGQSIDRVYELANLYSEIGVDAARRMVAIWSEAAQAAPAPTAADAQAWRDVAETARRALSEITRPREAQRDTQAAHGSGAQTQRARR